MGLLRTCFTINLAPLSQAEPLVCRDGMSSSKERSGCYSLARKDSEKRSCSFEGSMTSVAPHHCSLERRVQLRMFSFCHHLQPRLLF